MEDIKLISGDTEQEIWPTIEADLSKEEVFNYNAVVTQAGKQVEIYIDIDLGGGFEGGSEMTWLKAPLAVDDEFKFAIHDDDFVDEIGKFFGMQDVETGYPELDKHLVIKTNHEEKIRQIFADADVRAVFTSLDDFDCGIHHREDKPFLELNIDAGVTDPSALRTIYHAFYQLVIAIEGLEKSV